MHPSTQRLLIDSIPGPRFKRYLDEADGDESLALALYEWNVDASAAVSSTMSAVEVALRDTFDRQLRTWNMSQGGGVEWITHPEGVLAHIVRRTPNQSWVNRSPETALHPQWWEAKARDSMKDHLGCVTKHSPTHDDLVSGLTFGTWCFLIPKPLRLGGRQRAPQWTIWEDALNSRDNGCRGDAGFSASPAVAYHWCALLRYARNRASHLEPMLDVDELWRWHRTASRTIASLSSGAETMVTGPARIPQVIRRRPRGRTSTH